LLAERHANDVEPEPVVTAEEWLAAHRAAVVDDERTRTISEDDIVDDDAPAADRADLGIVDVREVAAAEPRQTEEDVVRVPSADQVSDSVGRARRSLAEVAARDEADRLAEADERAAQLGRWHDEDQSADEHDAADESVLEFEPGRSGV
jgi:hypothetical protein